MPVISNGSMGLHTRMRVCVCVAEGWGMHTWHIPHSWQWIKWTIPATVKWTMPDAHVVLYCVCECGCVVMRLWFG